MATYAELFDDLWLDAAMRNKIVVALAIGADSILSDSANFPATTADATVIANREIFAVRLLIDTRGWANRTWKLLLAANNTATQAQITSATDATIQTKVNGLLDVLAKANAVIETV